MKILQEGLQNLDQRAFDVVVIGAGGAGMAAALFAANQGQSVLLVERCEVVGGTTAWSAGTAWLPLTHHAKAVNAQDNIDAVSNYLNHAVGEQASPALRSAFLKSSAETVEELASTSEVLFRPYPKHPDYISDLPGSTLNGRALEPLPFDGRLLGKHLSLLRAPIPEFTVLGGMMVDRTDITHLLAMKRSVKSLKHALRILARHASDRLRYPRGTRLVMGNALTGRLLASLIARPSITLTLNTSLLRLEPNEPGGTGVVLVQDNVQIQVTAAKRVILASGGFNRHPSRREQLLPNIELQWCVGAPGHTGQAQDAAINIGARLQSALSTSAFWAPVSLRKRADGSTAVFPHFVMDRAKPGVLAVNQSGQRFVNESTSYHLFGLAMQAQPAYLICDANALHKYGFGMERPGTNKLDAFLKDGYLICAPTISELADRLGLPAPAVNSCVSDFNRMALAGVDTQFNRGTTAYQRNLGDPNATGNPCLGPLEHAPFYALKLYPGDIGACQGLVTNENGQVLDLANHPIAGLYAVGNDMQSIMGPVYPAPGITIGPALVFAYRATRDLH